MKNKKLTFFILLKVFFILNAFSYPAQAQISSERKLLNGNNNTNQNQINNKKPNISDEQLKGFLDEKGQPLFSESSRNINSDTLETDVISERIINGLVAGDEFGYSVSGAGDVNGDGYEDIIVGVPFNDIGGTNAGRAFIYFGGINFNTSPDVTLTGTTGLQLGYSVSSAGDFNSDGYDDVIIGLPGYSTNTGRAYIYLGGANMNSVIDLTLTGEATNNYFGTSVSAAGDLNGDGFSDVIVGAPNNASNTGEAYIYYGGSSLNNTVDVTLNEGFANNFFGISVSNAGDFNGDGFSDVIVGAYGFNSNTGRAYIYYGGSAMNNLSDNITFGFLSNEFYGYSVSDAGDFNGDGYSDVVIGGYGYSASTGRAYVLYGGANPDVTVDVILTGQFSGNEFGKSVSSAGDSNGDGYDDVIIGAANFNSGDGSAYLFNGAETGNFIANKIMKAENAGDRMGQSVSGCGDINGDGNDDFIVSANLTDQNGTSSGRVYLYYNTMTGNDISDLTVLGTAGSDYLGYSTSVAGDVNGDGFDDVIVGSYGYNSNQGRAYIYYGGSIMNNVADVTLTGGISGDYFGISVSSAGDVNGDGFDDVIVGANRYSSSRGRAYIFYGGSSMNNVADVTITGATAGDYLGTSVSKAGDFNGDGYSDVIVGAYGNTSDRGIANLYLGSASMNNILDLTFTGLAAGDYFGAEVSNAGDVNSDGYDDILISSYQRNNSKGEAYIYYGGSIPNNEADLTFSGATDFDFFGRSISDAKDINADGYDDIIVGAIGYPGGENRGRAYVYFGGTNMNTTADITVTGISVYDYLGYAVSGAGDVNGDNFDDFIIGSYGYSNYAGQATIYFGGSFPNSTPDITLAENNINGNFGISVCGGGDFNNDGYSDVAAGEYFNSSLGSATGAAHVFFSTPMNVNPRISSARDVPFDQGGKVKIKWNRSGYDYVNQNLITDYLIEISDPPGVSGYYWESVGSVPASFNQLYQYTVNTPNDSMGGNSGAFFFRITARTSDLDQFWRSNIMSGYSVDNLSPNAPLSLAALPDLNSVYLSWNANSESDLHHYNVYRNGIFLSTSAGNNFDDATVQDDSVYYYTVAAVDIHGNISPLSNLVNVNYNVAGTLNLTIIFEGFYNSSSNIMIAGDTARVYLRNSSPPYNIVDSAKGFVNPVTLTGSFRFYNAPTGNYFISIKQRNTIETWNSSSISYTLLSTINYDLTNSINQAFGDNMKQVDLSPVRFAIYSGDINQDGTIDASDVSSVDNDANISLSGYVKTDVTGDNFVDAQDVSIVDNNAFNSVSAIMP